MTLQIGKQIITMHILPNISKSKVDQAREFNQLIECNMKKIFFLKSHTQNMMEKLEPDILAKLRIFLESRVQNIINLT